MGFLDKLLGRGKKPAADTSSSPEPVRTEPEAAATESPAAPEPQQPPASDQQTEGESSN